MRNALRYFDPSTHPILAPEFSEELKLYGHIYMYRFLPDIPLRAYPISWMPAKCEQSAAMIVMILNNLDPEVAQFPQELVTYGGNGQVFSNWVQFRITLQLLSKMTEKQTLSLYSGHPLGLFPSGPHGPRAVITNGMVIPNYSSKADYDNMFALGVSMYGQMTAGSFCYIGPQGIVHGTTITLLNAGRQYLGVENLAGKVYVTAGLGGMSGAQAKAAVLAGCVGIVAEVCPEAIRKRKDQGWVHEVENDLEKLLNKVRQAKAAREALSIAYHGNVVLLWERLAEEPDLLVDLGSDQTSCHNVHGGGYWPVDVAYPAAKELLARDPARFAKLVDISLVRQVNAINKLAARGMKFWDYGNAFLLESRRAGADVSLPQGDLNAFRYPSYFQDIMGNIFSLGFGPFRWVCLSGQPDDLKVTDGLATDVLQKLIQEKNPPLIAEQYKDNLKWIKAAGPAKLVVGSQARILYSDREGRRRLAACFNDAIRNGLIQGPMAISRDHHDVSGTDSPYRETSDIKDGSAFTADMAVQNCIGDAFRGATWVSLHNGGGIGWGEVINGGFGLVLDGSLESGQRADVMLAWDVDNGVARRCWAGNANARLASEAAMQSEPLLQVTLPHPVDESVLSL